MNEEKSSFMDQLFTEPVYSDSPQAEALFLFIVVAIISGLQVYVGRKKEVAA